MLNAHTERHFFLYIIVGIFGGFGVEPENALPPIMPCGAGLFIFFVYFGEPVHQFLAESFWFLV